MGANLITLFRTVLAIISIALLSREHSSLKLVGIILIPVVMSLDMLDGYLARRQPIASLYGPLYDILADRIISFCYFIFFLSVQVCGYLPVAIIVVRGLVLDGIRCIAFKNNFQAFSDNKFNQSFFAKLLTQSYFSRGLYNSLKTILFILMAVQHCYYNISPSIISWGIGITVGWALIRSLPVLYMGYQLVTKEA